MNAHGTQKKVQNVASESSGKSKISAAITGKMYKEKAKDTAVTILVVAGGIVFTGAVQNLSSAPSNDNTVKISSWKSINQFGVSTYSAEVKSPFAGALASGDSTYNVSGSLTSRMDETPVDKTPMTINFGIGTNFLIFSGGNLEPFDIDSLHQIGAVKWDGNEKDIPIKDPVKGWVHCVVNKNWTGILRMQEPKVLPDGKSLLSYSTIPTENGSKVHYPYRYMPDDKGNMLVVTDEGLVGWIGSDLIYQDLNKQMGVDKLRGVEIADVKDAKGVIIKKILTAEGSSKQTEIIYENGQIKDFEVVNKTAPVGGSQ